MKRKDWILVIAVLFFCIITDQISKIGASGLISERTFGIFKMILVHNHGAMLGLFSDLPAVLRIVTLSTSGVFILCLYFFVQYIIPRKLLSLGISLSILTGGILCNVLDRILYGYVIDFMAIQIDDWHSPVWNLADVVQWLGYVLMIYSLFKYSEQLWPDKNDRKSFWINKKFQIKHSVLFAAIGIFITLICMVFSYTYLKVTIQELIGDNHFLINKFIQPFIYTFVILILIFTIILFSIGKLISHRIAGPLYAFERFLTDILEGKGLTKEGSALKLRTNDDFKHLEELAEQIKLKLNKMNSEKTVSVMTYSDDST